MPAELYDDVQQFAAEETLRRRKRVTASQVVREALQERMRRRRERWDAEEDAYLHALADKAEAEPGDDIPWEQVRAKIKADR